MNALAVFTILSIFQFCHSNITDVKTDKEKILQNKTHREIEPFTTILLNNESFSIPSRGKYPMYKSNTISNKRKGGSNGKMKIGHYQKPNTGRQYNAYKSSKIKPHYRISPSFRKDVAHNSELLPEKHQDKVLKNIKNVSPPKKKLHKRHFEEPIGYYDVKTSEMIKRNKIASDFGPTYRFVLTEATKAPRNDFSKSQTKSYSSSIRSFGEKSSASSQNEFFEDLNTNPWENAALITTKGHATNAPNYVPFSSSLTPARFVPFNSKRDNTRSFIQNGKNPEDLRLNQNMPMNPNINYGIPAVRSTVSWLITTVHPVHTMIFHQADIIERNLAAKNKKGKTGKDNSPGDESEFDDTVISFEEDCDQIVNETCCFQREVGDVLTLDIKIKSSKKSSSFQIRWMKVYHKFDSNKGKPLEIEAGKLPWNMVSGSEGRQLRLNPITNSDIDPNCFVAQVFLITKKHGKVLFTLLKRLVFRIEIPITDMGKLYAGEELSINIENFLSLPERGNMLFLWNLEIKPQEYESLPSNIKVSPSGRSVIIKELRKGRLGVLNCVIYSSNRYAVAKRRFNILKVENMKRRSTMLTLDDDPLSRDDLLRKRRCRHIIRRSQEEAKRRLKEGNKPLSRKKRFRRMEYLQSQLSELDCEPLSKKVYSRLVRSLLEQFTTEDPKLMPLEQLLELSLAGDGTLDDVIPHEVHYVHPKIKVISGTSAERSADHPISTNCSTNSNCTENAVCVFSGEQTNSTVRIGNCYCRPAFYRDGTTCHKIPSSNHREKRLKRNARNDFAVQKHLFYENTREIAKSTPETIEGDEDTEPPKVLAFEEEESFLLSDCIDDKDCNMHANCVQPANGHPYCKCRPGFRGNGIFCWEIMDYVPAEEQFLSDEEIDGFDEPQPPEIPQNRMLFRTEEPQEIEEEY